MNKGDRVTVDKKKAKLDSNQTKILASMIRRGGDGKVEIIRIDKDYAEVAGWSADALLGTLRVPTSSLKENTMSKSQEFLSEVSESNQKEAVKEAFAKVKDAVVRDLNSLFNSAMRSGAFDLDSYSGNPVVLAKIIMKAALISEADAFAIPDSAKKEVKNLSKFI